MKKILEIIDRVNQTEMEPMLLDKTISQDYNKFDPTVRTDIVKRRPKIKQLIIEVKSL